PDIVSARSKTQVIAFGDFRFDPDNRCVWRGNSNVGLTPKAFAVLEYLMANRSRLVTKDELLAHVWPDSYVTDSVLKVSIRSIRKALNDDVGAPCVIQTLHRRGYRFIAAVQSGDTAVGPLSELVGREEADAKLQGWLQVAVEGSRQIVFVVGEA